jgi:hypothetical protein
VAKEMVQKKEVQHKLAALTWDNVLHTLSKDENKKKKIS